MLINYDHQSNVHTEEGPQVALPIIFSDWKPKSLLDVGCGTGTWLKAALDFGIIDVLGIDGVDIQVEKLKVPPKFFKQQDLTKHWDLGRRFDVVFCLEVAEHLSSHHAKGLVEALINHSDQIIFSAACPNQNGQHHINCQWPEYWQELFNQSGFICYDSIRWRLWDNKNVEPWYRQNIFIAERNTIFAGKEPRIKSVAHPDMLITLQLPISEKKANEIRRQHILEIESGLMRTEWYVKVFFQAIFTKLLRNVAKSGNK